ncbi:MAG TPA: Vms1/Ankzf1 family peptidyl-tRNA hydrolase [Gemmatimonadales bacterium]|jgi:hypothetical protein
MTATLKAPTVGHKPAQPAPVVFVILDRSKARFFVDDDAGLRELAGPFAVWTRGGRFHQGRVHLAGVGEKRYHHIENEWHRRHYHTVAERLEACLKAEQAIGVIVGGAHRTVEEFRSGLSKAIDRQVLRVMALNEATPQKREMREAAEASRHFMP